ncbi:Coatomer subunit delta [Rhizoctonia solani]|uniref:Coatomer subunit delta n=1 Tax=Rhizoctonia solani TaxID=456999 RepID=A0A0K6FWX4_9AGAM|nr:Coatomer subunit delta [Rhizoctonia solani]
MVVLAASICTKGGKPVISRQFREMPRSRIDGLLTSFPKLIPANSQHTSIEAQDVRYVYQPLEDLYILLITNKGSNILQDIDTLHLFARVVSDICRTADEREISRNAFELLGAFDEVVNLGYREQVGLAQVRSILEMESHEEKIQEIIAKNKEAEAKEELKRRAKQLELQRREMQKRAQGGSGGIGNTYLSPGMGSGGYSTVPRYEPPTERRAVSPQPSGLKPAFKASGMKLGSKKGKQSELLDALGGELSTPTGSIPGTPIPPELTSSAMLLSPSPGLAVHEESVHVVIRERIKASILRDGRPKELEIMGDLDLKVADAADARVKLNIAPLGSGGEGAQFKQHPNVAKYAGGVGVPGEVKLKDPARGFPVGQPQPLNVLKWRWSSKDETGLPLSVTVWPSPTGDGTCEVNIEWELQNADLELRDLVISIPLPSGAYPTVSSHTGAWSINPGTHSLDWMTDSVSSDSEATGSLEFSIGGHDTDTFFPVKVDFKSEKSLIGVEVLDVERVGGEGSVTFSKEVRIDVEQYSIV